MVESDVGAELMRLAEGGEQALAELFAQYRGRLGRIVQFRLDRRLAGRLDEDDVLQESYVNASTRLPGFLDDPAVSVFVWLRTIVSQTMIDLHRRHLGADKRDAARDVSLGKGYDSQATSASLAIQLLGNLTSPSYAAIRDELSEQVRQKIEQMDATDREILALRHYEELSNSEVAEILEVSQATASIRYVRAIARLRDILEKIPGFFDQSEVTVTRDSQIHDNSNHKP